jgi:hypothetical protein
MSHLSPDSQTIASLGRQHTSTKPTLPAFSFSAASRDEISKLYISREHDKLTPSRWSPGAIYTVPSSLNTQTSYSFGKASKTAALKHNRPAEDLTLALPDSQSFKFVTFPSVLFGTDSRENMKNATILQNHPQAFFGKHSPGPQAYTVTQPPKHAVPSVTFGSKTKILASDCQTPANVGPGSYKKPAAVGVQVESDKPSQRTVKFGKAARAPSRKVVQPVTNVDGGVAAIGRQYSSKLKNAAVVVFGTGSRAGMEKVAMVGDAVGVGAKPRLPHPVLPLERDIVRFS